MSAPNIIIILADDWGWGDAGANGSDWIKTPAFDRVANKGLRFRLATKCSTHP